MAEMRRNTFSSADVRVVLWLFVWLIVNLLQAGLTELADDEAYYVMFSADPAWGYFDHPPMTAMLVWLGTHLFCGEFGVRFFFVLLQPLYLWMFWRLIRPDVPDRKDADLYVVLSAATLMLQLYGFIAVPDAPLMFTVALFLLSFDLFDRQKTGSWILLGLSMAMMAYSKYHGALVVLCCLATNPKIFRNPRLYLASALALVLFIPHLKWQYDHEWASFAYHLSGRNASFRFSYVSDFVANMLVVFNPLFVPVFFNAWKRCSPDTALKRSLKWMPVFFIGFFLLSSFRGYVQPQWVIACVFGMLYVMFTYVRKHPRTYRFVMKSGVVTIVLVLLLRVEMIFNPLGIRYEIFNNEESYAELSDAVGHRPVVFNGSYASAAKYQYYAGGEAYCQPNIRYRTHQWQFRDDDSHFIGRETAVMCNRADAPSGVELDSATLSNGRTFSWFIDPDFRPVRKIRVDYVGIPKLLAAGDSLSLNVTLSNPYVYPVEIGHGTDLVLEWKFSRFDVIDCRLDVTGVIPAGGDMKVTVPFVVPDYLSGRTYMCGFAIRIPGRVNWFNSNAVDVKVLGRK